MDAFVTNEYVLLSRSVLARVTKITPDGFDFDCENGAWAGSFDVAAGKVRIERSVVLHDCSIASRAQPPAEIRRDGYNAIIPWMEENAK